MARARRKTSKRPKAAARRPAGKQVRPVPAGYRTVTAYLTVNDGARALEFYQRAFGARETERIPGPGGKIMHAEMRIGDSIVMLSDEFPGLSSCKAPTTLGGTTGSLFLYVPDVDAAFKQAVAAGCTVIMPLTNMFWGDRFGKLQDPFGNQWSLATHKEDVSPAEMGKRARDAMARMAAPHGAT
jgi:PhnB protein